VNQVESAITSRTRALYAQHTFGVPCNLAALQDIGARHGIPIIEDGGHALGATINGRPVGSFTEAYYFTTDHSKMTSTYLGGIAATNDPAIARRIRAIQQQSTFPDLDSHSRLLTSFLLEYPLSAPTVLWLGKPVLSVLFRLKLLFGYPDELLTTPPSAYPYPCRLSSQQASLGRSQLRLLGANLAHRRRLAEMLESHIGWYGVDKAEMAQSSWLRYSFLVRDRAALEDCFRKHFDLGIWFTSPLHGRKENLEAVCYTPGSCQVAEWVSGHIANFPTHPRIPLETLENEMVKSGPWIRSQLLSPQLSP